MATWTTAPWWPTASTTRSARAAGARSVSATSCPTCGQLWHGDVGPSITAEQIRAVFDAWTDLCKHPRAKLTADRRTRVRARLREGYTSEDLIRAVRGAAKGAYVDGR